MSGKLQVLEQLKQYLTRGMKPLVAQTVESPCNAGDLGSIPEWRRSPGEGNGTPLQYSCLKNPMDRGAWQATVRGAAESDTE